MIEEFKEMLLEANSGSEEFNSGINKANKKAVSVIRKLLKKQSETEMKDTHYFISYYGYVDGGKTNYGSSVVEFSNKKNVDEIENNVIEYALKLAKSYNSRVNNVHVIAFNKV